MFLRKTEGKLGKRGKQNNRKKDGKDRIEDQELMRLGTGDGEAVSLGGGELTQVSRHDFETGLPDPQAMLFHQGHQL